MHTYQQMQGGWSVGYWLDARWQSVRECPDEKSAAEWASFLNGGFPPPSRS